MPCHSCDIEDRRQSLGKAQAQRWLFPTSSQVAAGAGKNIVSAGECRTIGQQLADFVQILDETPSVRFLINQDTIYYTWKPGQVKNLHLGLNSNTCCLMRMIWRLASDIMIPAVGKVNVNHNFHVYLRMFPFLVTVTTTGQHKRSTTKMLQIEFISDQKSQHTAMLKSENTVFPLRLRKLHGAINIGMGCQSKVVMESALCKLCTTK